MNSATSSKIITSEAAAAVRERNETSGKLETQKLLVITLQKELFQSSTASCTGASKRANFTVMRFAARTGSVRGLIIASM